ncbi:MAG: hypothetical protein FWF82_03015 [Oscillospiraceae bacterium]|nr:hypothetical protein [Oscillospiraceae bacterium]
MKKIMTFIIAGAMSLTLAACGNTDDSDTGNNSNTNKSDTTTTAAAVANNSADTDTATTSETSVETESGESNPTAVSDGYEKFSQIELGMTEDEVNAVLGEPARVEKAYYYYNITVNGKEMEVEVWINAVSGVVTYKRGDFDKSDYRAEFMDSATDLSKADELKEGGSLKTYDDCKEAFKTPGFLTSFNQDGTKIYLWVNEKDGYMRVTFREDGTIKTFSGYC